MSTLRPTVRPAVSAATRATYGLSQSEIVLVDALNKRYLGTFTRNGTATYFDSNGVLQTAAANVPRWGYDPATGILRGLLIEGSTTRETLYPTDFSLTWGITSALNATNSGNSIVAGATPSYFNMTTATANAAYSRGYSVAASTTYCGCAIIEILSSSSQGIEIGLYDSSTNTFDVLNQVNLSNLTATVQSGYPGTSQSVGVRLLMQNGPNGGPVYLVWASCIPATSTDTHRLITYPFGIDSSTGSGYMHAAWVEDNSFPTSLILASPSSTATRATDNLVITNLNRFDFTKGTFVAEADVEGESVFQAILNLEAADGLFRINRNINTIESFLGGRVGVSPPPVGTLFKVGLSYDDSSSLKTVTLNGSSSATGHFTGFGAASALYIGGVSGVHSLYGHVKSLTYYPYAMTASQLQAATA